jgi:hypothetical protein
MTRRPIPGRLDAHALSTLADITILCPGCNEKKPAAMYAVYISADTGQQYPHALCRNCADEAARSKAGHDRISQQVELHFLEGGRG